MSLPLPARDNFHPLGNLSREQMREQYRDADLFLLPTRYESFGISVAEAMSCGCPVVAVVFQAMLGTYLEVRTLALYFWLVAARNNFV